MLYQRKPLIQKNEVLDSTTKCTNAYAVYSTELSSQKAVNRFNGTITFDRHFRVDGVARLAKIDHRRCLFVGNLSFGVDEACFTLQRVKRVTDGLAKAKIMEM